MDQKNKFQCKFVWEKINTPIEDYQQSLLYQKSDGDRPLVDPDEIEEMVEEAYEEEEVYVENKVPIQLINALMEQNKYLESFEFWTLHTNFDIKPEIEKIIQNTAGVESFQKITRYRVKIGLTKSGLFNNREVKLDIQNNLNSHFSESPSAELEEESPSTNDVLLSLFDAETQKEVEKAKDELCMSSSMWSMFVFPNGQISQFKHSSEEEMLEKVIFLSEAKSILGGHILCSESHFGV